MRSYRRILVPILSGSHAELQLSRVGELADVAQRMPAQILVVRVIDPSNGIEPDGPAAGTRRLTDVQQRLDLQLARNNLGWAEARVVRGDPKAALADVIRSWQPDLIVTCEGHWPEGIAAGADILTVAHCGILRRLAVGLGLALRHA